MSVFRSDRTDVVGFWTRQFFEISYQLYSLIDIVVHCILPIIVGSPASIRIILSLSGSRKHISFAICGQCDRNGHLIRFYFDMSKSRKFLLHFCGARQTDRWRRLDISSPYDKTIFSESASCGRRERMAVSTIFQGA